MKQNDKKIAESKSLWNYSLSPGWTKEEVHVLKIALMKFGVGRWTSIEKYVNLTFNFTFLTGQEFYQPSQSNSVTYRPRD